MGGVRLTAAAGNPNRTRTLLALALTSMGPALLPARALAEPGTVVPVPLGQLGRTAPFVYALTEGGVAGGNTYLENGFEHACLWNEDGTLIDLLPAYDLGGTSVLDVNERGDVITAEVDEHDPEDPKVVFHLRHNGVSVAASAFGMLTLNKINEHGDILGAAAGGRVALWRDRATIDVGPGLPIDLNNAGQVLVDVGSS